MLKIEEITAINGSGKQLAASITFLIEETYNEQVVCQLDTGATCNVISQRNLIQLLQRKQSSSGLRNTRQHSRKCMRELVVRHPVLKCYDLQEEVTIKAMRVNMA